MNLLMLAEASNVHTQRWSQALARRGWQVSVLTFRDGSIEGVRVIPIEVPRFGAGYMHRWWRRYVRYLQSIIVETAADLVHVHFLRDYPLMPAGAADPPIVVSTWGSDVVAYPTDPPDTASRRCRKVALLQGAAAVTATTEHLADATAAFGGIDRRDITVIPFGVDVDRFATAKPGLNVPGPVVGVIKHLEGRYGLDSWIRAMPRVLNRFEKARFVIIGHGPQEAELRRLAAQLDVADRIDWRGLVPNCDVPRALAQMDVFVMPSLVEAFGVSAVEAQAAGVPVVFSDLPGATEAVTHEVSGLAVPPGDPAALADAVCRLLGDDALRRRLGRAGRRMVRQRFDFARNVDRMEEVYREALDGRPRPARTASQALSVAD
ncbi:MAG: glycosyltransferase family 4 protein [Phycisphaerae bacterium]